MTDVDFFIENGYLGMVFANWGDTYSFFEAYFFDKRVIEYLEVLFVL